METNARTYSISGPFGRERMTIRQHADRTAMYKFLNTGSNATQWREYTGSLPKGVYASVAREWRNVKTLDPSVLAHV